MISTVLFAVPLLAVIVGAALVTPAVIQPTVPFGVRVPPERVHGPVVTAELRRYRLWVLVGCGGAAVACLLIAAFTGQPAAAPLGVLATTGVWLLVYARAHVAVAAAKQREGWYAELPQEVAVDTSLRTSPEPFPWPWAIPALALLAATIVIGIVRYPHLPAHLATHYGASGHADAFARTSIASAFSVVFVQAALTLFTIGAAWLWMRSRPDLDPRRPTQDARGHRVWTGRMARATLVLVACLNVTFFLIDWAVWQGSALPALATLLPTLAGVVVLIGVALRSAPLRGTAPEAGETGPVTRDDDRFWIGGLIYYNRDDPVLLVPRRFGVGMTLNVGNPWSWLILAVTAAVLAGLLSLRHFA
jgi:uncharacterized membrane protein